MRRADGDESREDKNERILNDKFVDLFKIYNFIVRDSRGGSAWARFWTLFWIKCMSTKCWTMRMKRSLSIIIRSQWLRTWIFYLARYDVDIIVSGDNDGDVKNSRKPNDILPKSKFIIESPAANVLHIFNLRLSSSLSIPTQLCYGKTGLRLLINFSLSTRIRNLLSRMVVGIIILYIYLEKMFIRISGRSIMIQLS